MFSYDRLEIRVRGVPREGVLSVVFVLLFASLLVASGFLAAFFWAVKSGQFEDTTTPAMRVLGEDDAPAPVSEKSEEQA